MIFHSETCPYPCHSREVVDQLQQMDFVVVDTVLRPKALQRLTDYLLRSTIWFDVTNGAALVSHMDDGLVFEGLQRLGQLLATALTPKNATTTKPYRVVDMYALAMNVSSSRDGPVASSK
jgi:hypothetical protein